MIVVIRLDGDDNERQRRVQNGIGNRTVEVWRSAMSLFRYPPVHLPPRYPRVSLNWIKTRREHQFPRRKIGLINSLGMGIDQF